MERKSLKVSLSGEGPRVLEPEEIGEAGTGWREDWYEPEDGEEEYKSLCRVAWVRGNSVEAEEPDEHGLFGLSYGSVVPDDRYNQPYGWRLWTEKPSEELREKTPWEKA